jgi:hypothetical protein
MKKPLLVILLICAGIILNAQIDNCAHTNTSWKSDKEAINYLESESFATTESVLVEGESWMESANFYSCNADFGFLIVKSMKKSFVHQNVPTKVWEALKSANSKGGYYNFYIKNKFKLQKGGEDHPIL